MNDDQATQATQADDGVQATQAGTKAERETEKVEPVAEDLPKEEPGAGPAPERTEA